MLQIENLEYGLWQYQTGVIRKPEELAKGLLSKSHFAMVNGGAKTYKTWFLMQLAVIASVGGKWLNFDFTRPCKVLYVDGELSKPYLMERFQYIGQGLNVGVNPGMLKYICAADTGLTLRQLMEELTQPEVITENFDIIIIDPFYIFNTEDENAAHLMNGALSNITQIRQKTGAAVILSHHHSKGNQGYKAGKEQASGSGVFSRKPDLIINIQSIKSNCEKPASRINTTSRHFKNVPDYEIYFNPVTCINELETQGELKNSPPADSSGVTLSDQGVKAKQANESKRREEEMEKMVKAYEGLSQNGGVTFKDFCGELDKKHQVVSAWMEKSGKFFKEKDENNRLMVIFKSEGGEVRG